MGCIQGLRIRKILVGERSYPTQREVDDPSVVIIDEIMPSKSNDQRNDRKCSKETEECSKENHPYQDKYDNVHGDHKRKQNGFDGLTTDAIPTPRRNGKTKKSLSSSLSSSEKEMKDDDLNDLDELDKKYSLPTPEIQIDEPEDDDYECDKRRNSGSSKNEDEDHIDLKNKGASVAEEEERGKHKKKNKIKKYISGYFNSKDISPQKNKGSPVSECVPAFLNSDRSCIINGSSNIHIGPIYQQKITINNVRSVPRREPPYSHNYRIRDRSPVHETEAIRAVKECQTQLKIDTIRYIAKEIGHCWREMGRSLGYTDGRLDAFDDDYRPHTEKVYQVLLNWYQNKPENATFATLSQVLWEVEERAAVERLAEYIKEQSL